MTNAASGNDGTSRADRLPEIPVGVIGLGLMGTSIIACLLSSGHPVLAVTRNAQRRQSARDKVRELLEQLSCEGILKGDPAELVRRFEITDNYADLADRHMVIESIIESLEAKKRLCAKWKMRSPRAL